MHPTAPPGRWSDSEWESHDGQRWERAEYSSDAGWDAHPWNDSGSAGSQQAQLDPRVEVHWNDATGMQRLQNLDMSECPAVYPDDMTDAPWALHTYMNSTRMALRNMSDEALLDLEQRYVMN